MNNMLLLCTLVLTFSSILCASRGEAKEPILEGPNNDKYSREFDGVLREFKKILQEEVGSDEDMQSFDVNQNHFEEVDDATEVFEEEGNVSDDDFLENEKRPFVLGNGKYTFGKRSPYYHEKNALPFGQFRREPYDERNEKIPFVLRGKRPLVLSGSNFGKRASLRRKRPFVGVGYKNYVFGKRSKNVLPSHLKEIRNEEINNVDDMIDSRPGRIAKRPFVMGGGGFSSNGKRPSMRESSRYYRPLYMGSGFRFGKRSQDQYDGDFSRYEKRSIRDNDDEVIFKGWSNYPIPVRYAKKEVNDEDPRDFDAEMVDDDESIDDDAAKRAFHFRNDFLFDKLRHKSKLSPKDQNPVDESYKSHSKQPTHSLEVPFRYVKRPFTIGGGFGSRIGKRPFVLSGQGHGYLFGK